jgi:hypothetical protein
MSLSLAIQLGVGAALTVNAPLPTPEDVVAGSNQSVAVGNNVDVVAILGSNDTISGGSDDWMLVGNGDFVTAGAGSTITAGNYDTIVQASGTVDAGNNDVITLVTGGSLLLSGLGSGDLINAGGLTATGVAVAGDGTITLGANQHVTIDGTGDTIMGAQGDYVTFGGQAGSSSGAAQTKVSDTVGANTTGITLDSGLGTDTIAGGVGYEGGNAYIGSYHDDADGAAGIGSCINYSDLGLTAADAGLYTTVNLDTGIATGYAATGQVLWTDTLVDMQQAKAANGNGDVLISNNSYYCELKGAGGTTSYYAGDNGTTVYWGWNTDVSQDIAYGDTNPNAAGSEFAWRIDASDPNGNDPTRAASVLGETIVNFEDIATNTLNFSAVNSLWNGLAVAGNWSAASDGHGGTDLVVAGLTAANPSLPSSDAAAAFDRAPTGGIVADLAGDSFGTNQLQQMIAAHQIVI